MVRFLLGRGGSGKTYRVLDEISCAAKEGCSGMVLLVPEQQSHAMERKLCEVAGNSISMSAECATFRSLCRRVAAKSGGLSKTLLDDGARLIHLYRAVSQSRSAFKVLKTAAVRPEFLDTLLMLIDQVKACGLTPEALMEKSAQFPKALREKLEDISIAYAAYQAQMTQNRIDPIGELQKLEEDLKACDFFRGRKVWIDGFTGFTGIEYKILRLIFAQAEQVTVSLCADPEDSSTAFAKANETHERLRSMTPRGAETVVLRENLRAVSPGIAHLEKYLISDHTAAFDGTGAPELFECENIYRECELAAAYALKLTREEGWRFRDISVSVRDVESYAATVEAVFGYYGVPVYLSRKSPVLEKAPVAIAVNALKCVCSGFKYDDMLRYIKNGMTGLNLRLSDILEEYMSIWHLNGSDWSREEGFKKHPLGYGCEEDELSARMLRLLNKMRGRIRTPLINLKNAMKSDPTGEGCARAVFAYLDDIRLPERLERRADMFRRQGDLQSAEEYGTLWKVLCGAVNSIGQVLGDTVFEPEEFMRLFVLVLSKYQVGTIPTALDRVSVGDLSRPGVTGNVRCQIILGVNDGTVPKLTGDSALFTESECREMCDAGIELIADSGERLEEEFRLVYTGMTAPSERLVVSRPLTQPSGEEGRESFIYTRLRELFPHTVVRRVGDEVQAAAPAPCFDAVARGGSEWSGAREWFSKKPEWADKLELAARGSRVPRGPIKDKANIRGVFGGEIRLSASRADVFGACRYRYFLQYGLKLKQRENAKLDAPVAGTLIHEILEKTMYQIEALGGTRNVSADKVEEIARACGAEYAETKLGGIGEQTPRFKYLFDRLCNIAVQVAKDVCEELNSSSFKPLSYELPVSDRIPGGIPAVKMSAGDTALRLEGFIDRVDGMETSDGKLYIRVVDYKTGKKDFKMDEALNGLNIQLLVYLFALEKEGKKLYGKEILPAGVLYIPARDPELLVSGDESDEMLRYERESALKRKGVLVKDADMLREMEHDMERSSRFLPVSFDKDGNLSSKSSVISAEHLEKLKGHMGGTLKDIAETLAKGEIGANPYYKSRTESACSFCPYKSACMFDEKNGDKARYLIKTKAKEFFAGEGGASDGE